MSMMLFLSQVVLIGDSLTCGPFGDRVFEHLKTKYEEVTLYCAVSSAPLHWVTGKNPPKQVCMTKSESDLTIKKCDSAGRMIKLDKILADHPHADVIVALGTNSLMSPKIDRYYTDMMKGIESRKCSWIAPPHINPAQAKGFSIERLKTLEKNLTPFYDSLITANQERCRFIDSRPFTSEGTAGYQTVDGVHRTQEAGRFWADGMSDQL